MNEPQPHPRPDAAEHPHAQHADEEHRVGVVAEGQQPLRLRPGQTASPVQVRRRFRSDGIAAHKAQQQGGAAHAVHPEQRLHQSCQHGGQQLSQPQGQQQGGHHQKGKQRRDHRPGTQGQRLRRRGADKARLRQKQYQNPAEGQTGRRPPTHPHTNHPLISMRLPGKPCRSPQVGQARRIQSDRGERYGAKPKGAGERRAEHGGGAV